jgi:predicted DNA-binding transcriptional regulator YafY
MRQNTDEDEAKQPKLEETKRTARILEIVQLIAIHPRCHHRSDMAAHFEVSERMIQKDLEIIRHGLKLPLLRDEGGYYFERLPHLPTTDYSFSEAVALIAAARAAQAIPGINSVELAAAIARLEMMFPPEFRPLLREATEALPRRAAKGQRQTMLAVLHRALIERRQLQITYCTGSRAGDCTQRIVEPYHILPYGRSWHLIAYDHRREQVLVFKVDRVQEADLLGAHYLIPPGFDVNAYLGDGWGMMRGAAGQAERVELVFEPEAGRWVAEEEWHPSQESETLPDGRVRMTFLVGVTPEMVGWLMHYGCRVQVVAPGWLRERVKEEHRRAEKAEPPDSISSRGRMSMDPSPSAQQTGED